MLPAFRSHPPCSVRSRAFGGVPLLALFLIVAAPARADDQADAAFAQSKAAFAAKDIERGVALVCEAARLDPRKYEKKCDSAQKLVAGQLAQFDQNIATGEAAFQHRDYAGAVRELSKIAYGPHREKAQSLIAQANAELTHSDTSVEKGTEFLRSAQSAYDTGDLAAAAAAASRVKAESLQPIAQQLLRNIRTYNDTIRDGDALLQAGKYPDAKAKYEFALRVKNNGPGDPGGKLQKIAGLMAAAKAPSQPNQASTQPPGRQPPPADPARVIKTSLAEAHADERKGKLDPANAAYDRVLQLDPHQAEALAGKQHIADLLRVQASRIAAANERAKLTGTPPETDPKPEAPPATTLPPPPPTGLEATLAVGIRNYYHSDFTGAEGAITRYLAAAGGQRSKGAAHFYLGASYLARAFFAGRRSKGVYDSLQQSAAQEFHLAKQENYKPVERYVSSRILAAWNLSS